MTKNKIVRFNMTNGGTAAGTQVWNFGATDTLDLAIDVERDNLFLTQSFIGIYFFLKNYLTFVTKIKYKK